MAMYNDDRREALSRRQFFRLAATAVGGGVLGSVIAACGSSPSAPADTSSANTASTSAPASSSASSGAALRFVTNHGAGDVPNFEEVITNFHGKHPDIKVELLNISDSDQFYTTINTQAVGNSLPDVWYTRTFDIASNAAKGWQISLDEYIQRDKAEVNPDDFWPAEVNQMTYQGKLYSLPYDFSNLAVYYNKDMFEKEGVPVPTEDWTWDDAFAIGEKFVKKDGDNQTRWGLAFPTYNWFFMGILSANGGQIFSDDFKKSLINSPENVQTFNYFYDKMVQGIAPLPGATPTGVDPFGGGLVAMNINGSWATISTRDAVGDRFKWDVVKLPKGTSGKRGVSAAGGAWGIANNSKFKDEAWEFLKFLSSTESINLLISRQTRSIPGRKSSAAEWEKVAKSGNLPPEHVQIFSEQMQEDAINWNYPAYWNEFDKAWNNRVQGIFAGTAPEEALTQLEADINDVAPRYYK